MTVPHTPALQDRATGQRRIKCTFVKWEEKMTQVVDEAIEIKTIVLAFDICASSIIVEDLARADNLTVVRDMFIKMRDWLRDEKDKFKVEICNFTGDGWILLFPTSIEGASLVNFMLNLLLMYLKLMDDFVIKRMEHKPANIGISFGASKGPVVKFKMFERIEYVGRPINVACRLQGAIKELIKEKEQAAVGKLCVPRALYHEKFEGVKGISSIQKDMPLHNIAGGLSYQCVLVDLLPELP
jgi:hypothetical protein